MRLPSYPFLLAALAGLGTITIAPALASAQTVAVLGIRSVDGDDEFARDLTGALRHAATQVRGWSVSEREVTLTQMALAHGCEEPDPGCLALMADSLQVERIIYGDVRRTSASEQYDFSVILHIFNADSDQIEHTVTDTVPHGRRDIDDLRDLVRRYIAALSGAPRTGTLHINVNVPGAQVFVDGELLGTADTDGRLTATDVPAGTRSVRVVAPGHHSFRSTVSVEAYGEATFEAELEAGGGSGGGGSFPVELVTGAGLLVVAAGLAAGWIGSWVHLRFGLEQDPDYQAYRRTAGPYLQANPALTDVCQAAQSSVLDERTLGGAFAQETRLRAVERVCNEAPTWEVLQFVFGIGAAAAGVGAYFLVTALTGGDASAAQAEAWQLTPSFGPNHAYVGVARRF